MINTVMITKKELKENYSINIEDCEDCAYAIEETQWYLVLDISNTAVLEELQNFNNTSRIEVKECIVKSAIVRLKLKEIFPQYDQIVIILVGDYSAYE